MRGIEAMRRGAAMPIYSATLGHPPGPKEEVP